MFIHLVGVTFCPLALRPDRMRANPPQAQGEAIEVPAMNMPDSNSPVSAGTLA